MKLNGFVGKGTGKLGSSVFAVSGGEQIVRQYNPNVSNPNTEAQVDQRAKFKLMSQLAAALAPAIAFKKTKLVSARNKFVSANIGLALKTENKVRVDLRQIDLTGSLIGFPDVSVTDGEDNQINVQLASAAAANIAAVVYVEAGYVDEQQINLLEVKAVSVAGANRQFASTMTAPAESCVVLAYGIVDDGSGNIQRYADYYCTASAYEGELELVKKAILADATFTKTVGVGLDL